LGHYKELQDCCVEVCAYGVMCGWEGAWYLDGRHKEWLPHCDNLLLVEL
jgi:hypothetical protein